jgi:hypothetical protein
VIWHPSLQSRWLTFPEHRQILMICNELNRADSLQSDPKEYRNALERALELMDFTIDDRRTRIRLREFLRARLMMAELYAAAEPHSTKTLQRTLIQLYPCAWRYLHGIE